MNVSFNSYIGIRKVNKKLDVLSSKEYVLLDYERNLALYGESGIRRFQNAYGSFQEIEENYGNRKGVDWQEEAFGRVTTSQNYRVNISGGNKELKYSLSYNYVKDLGAMIKAEWTATTYLSTSRIKHPAVFKPTPASAMTNRKHTVWELRKETTVSTKWNISCNTALSIH